MIGGRIFPIILHNPVTTFAMIANRPRQAKPKNRKIIDKFPFKKSLMFFYFHNNKMSMICKH